MPFYGNLAVESVCLPCSDNRDDGAVSLVEGFAMGQMFSHLDFP